MCTFSVSALLYIAEYMLFIGACHVSVLQVFTNNVELCF